MRSQLLPSWSFGRVGPVLELAGFDVIPIRGKAPIDKDWNTPRSVASHLPARARCNVGMRTSRTPVIDIDIRNSELARALATMIRKEMGEAPVRIGQAPKMALVYRTNIPFRKLSTAEFVLPGDVPGDKAHKVEILGHGQQLAISGIHPDTGREYFWPHDHLLDLEWGDLTEIWAEQATKAVTAAEQMIRAFGGRPRARLSVTKTPAERQPGPLPRMVKGLDEAQLVLKALHRIDPNKLDYDGWVQVAYGLKAAFGECGRDRWMQWSQRSEKDQAETTAKTWGWVRPERAGWRYLLTLAETGHGR